jgi:hypothetical protein
MNNIEPEVPVSNNPEFSRRYCPQLTRTQLLLAVFCQQMLGVLRQDGNLSAMIASQLYTTNLCEV